MLSTSRIVKRNFKSTQTGIYKYSRALYSSNKHNTNFDYHLDWLINKIFTRNFTLVRAVLALNVGLFLYSNLRPTKAGRHQVKHSTSFSEDNLRKKDYVNLLFSVVGSRRLDDVALETAVLLTIGQKLERIHGTPFVFKMFVFSTYLAIMSSLFWVNSKYAKNSRYLIIDDVNTEMDKPYMEKFMSAHAFSASLVYFYAFRFNKLAVLPIAALDLWYWGPYYSSGLLTGVAAGLIF